MNYAQYSSDPSNGGLNSHTNKLLDIYLNEVIKFIPLGYRYYLCPIYVSQTALLFIENYEEKFPDGIDGNCIIPPEVFNKLTVIYGSLKYYFRVLACNDRSRKNFNARCEFLSYFGYNEKVLRSYYDVLHNRYNLFEALHYFMPRFSQRADILESEIARYVFNFKVLQPWFDYEENLELGDDFIILTPAYLEYICAHEKSQYLTMPFMMSVLAVIYGYKPLKIIINGEENYNLVKKRLLKEMGIPPNRKKIEIRNSAHDPENVTVVKLMFVLMYAKLS